MRDRAAQLRRMLEDDPNDAFCLYGLGQEHARDGEVVAAIAWFDRAIEADAKFAYAYFHKAKAQERLGDSIAAAATLRAGLAAARDAGDAHAASEIQAYLESLDS